MLISFRKVTIVSCIKQNVILAEHQTKNAIGISEFSSSLLAKSHPQAILLTVCLTRACSAAIVSVPYFLCMVAITNGAYNQPSPRGDLTLCIYCRIAITARMMIVQQRLPCCSDRILVRNLAESLNKIEKDFRWRTGNVY